MKLVKDTQCENHYYKCWDDLIKCNIVDKPYTPWVGKHLMISMWERRIGKSTSLIDTMKWNWNYHNHKYAVIYVRSRLNQSESFARTFNTVNQGEYMMTDTHIFRIKVDGNGKELKRERQIVGFVTSLSTFETLKSQIGDIKVNLVVYDEFNDYDETNLIGALAFYQTIGNNPYIKFLELIASFETTQPDLLVMLMGNKVNAQNDILLNLNFEIPKECPQFADIQDRSLMGYNVKIINGGKEYSNCHKGNQLFKALAEYNPIAKRYFASGDFLMKGGSNVKCRSSMVELPTEQISHLALTSLLIDMKLSGDNLYLYENYDDDEPQEIFPLNLIAYTNFANCSYATPDDKVELCEMIIHAIKEHRCYFSSNYIRNNIIGWLAATLKVNCEYL